MKKGEPAHIIHYYFKRLNQFAEKMKHGFSEETIHLFRVDIKKLRAFLRMMRSVAKEPDLLKFPHKFKKMYSLTGKIRDRQLCLKRIREYDTTKDKKFQNKISILEEEIKQLTGVGDNFLDKKEFFEIGKKIIKELPGFPGKDLVKNFFLQKLDVISEITAKGDYKDKELHNVRKSIKDIIYIIRIFRDDIKAALPFLFWNNDELKKAEDLSHTLGLFNDACIALSFLQPVNIKKTSSAEMENLASMRRKWLADKRQLKKNIITKMTELRKSIP